MKKKEKIVLIEKTLDRIFPHPSIPLKHSCAFTLLVAVVLSARSTDARVNATTPTLFAKASTPQKMALCKPEEIQEIIRPCGLSPQKSRALVGLSQILVEKYKGEVPKTFEDLELLPGVGHKTASVVLAQAFKIPAFPVDTHIYRCARRWGLSSSKTVEGVERDLKKVFLKKDWIKRHLQIIYFGRAYCPARGHLTQYCPICRNI